MTESQNEVQQTTLMLCTVMHEWPQQAHSGKCPPVQSLNARPDDVGIVVIQCLFQASLAGGNTPKLTIPPNGCQIVCSIFFFDRDNELQIYHGNFLVLDKKHSKLFVIKQSKGCKIMPKMHQNTFRGRAPPRPLGELNSPDLAAMESLLREGKSWERRGPTYKGTKEREGAYF